MHAKATYDDARLILKLYEARREDRMRKARAWFVASFKPKTLSDLKALCPPGSDENASYRMVATYWEMVASFVTSGVLNWERLRDVVPAIREDLKDPKYYGNLETVATDYIEYLKQRGPETYKAFSARVRG